MDRKPVGKILPSQEEPLLYKTHAPRSISIDSHPLFKRKFDEIENFLLEPTGDIYICGYFYDGDHNIFPNNCMHLSCNSGRIQCTLTDYCKNGIVPFLPISPPRKKEIRHGKKLGLTAEKQRRITELLFSKFKMVGNKRLSRDFVALHISMELHICVKTVTMMISHLVSEGRLYQVYDIDRTLLTKISTKFFTVGVKDKSELRELSVEIMKIKEKLSTDKTYYIIPNIHVQNLITDPELRKRYTGYDDSHWSDEYIIENRQIPYTEEMIEI